MQDKIEERSDFHTNIQNEPIALLKSVNKLMHDLVISKYPYESLTKALSDIINIRQR